MLSMRKNSSNNELGVSSKKFQQAKDEQVVVVELGLKLEQDHNRSFQFNHDHHGDGDGSCCGPAYNMISNNNNNTPTIYSSSVAASTTPTIAVSSSTPSTSTTTGLLQPFDVSSAYYYSSANYPFFKSSGGMATTTMGFPFTATQWKELERQAMIYKYMMASLPVPPDLLYSSFPTNFSTSTFAPASYFLGKYGSGISMRWSGNSKDAEPGRCRRTDGKKWRCSRDVAPNQKYCERHMHRGRPRSRKHVELQQQQQQQQQQNHHSSSISNISFNNNSKDKDNSTPAKKTRLNNTLLTSNDNHGVGSKVPFFDHSLAPSNNNNNHPFDYSRNLGWNDEQQWNQFMQANMNASVFQHEFVGEPLSLNSHGGFNDHKSDDMVLLERPLIDAWSNGNKLSLSCSNGGYNNNNNNNDVNANGIDEEMCQIHMGLGLIDSWVGSTTTTPGGPLAEVLRPGNPAMSDGCEGELITPPATAVSSPSGVLQKAFATFSSDSSGSTSPTTCHNSKANSDMPFHWLN